MRRKMNMKKKDYIPSLLVLAVLITILPCSQSFAKQRVLKREIRLNCTRLNLQVGKVYTLRVIGTTKNVRWSSNKKAVASVNNHGIVTGVRKGNAIIFARVEGKKLQCRVSVN